MLEQYKNKRVLITGGMGMIGSSIAHRLVELGAEVRIVDARIKPYGANDFNIKDVKEKINLYQADIRDKEKMTPLVEWSEIIFNLAGQVSHNDSIKNPFLDTEINYIGHLNVLEIAKKVNPLIKILYSGTRMQYGKVEKIPVAEDHPQRPLSPYALNKSAAENLYLFYHRIYRIPVVIFRITNPYGPRGQVKHHKYCIVNWFTRLAIENKGITIFGDGSQVRDYLFIDNLTDAFVKAGIEPAADGEVFNLGSGEGTTFKEMAKTIVDIAGSGSITHVPWPDHYINVETGDFVADISKIKKIIDWKPEISLKEGIRRTVEFYRKYMKFYL
ncbi:MAG: SDR family NAD(P)-dependent oxidoreductase [Candidatus Aminicenantes bacterium]|nr:SDR family NAD(P)-dependent oxidoreductase [Candidatus Aminicenantes bacterium]